jgi:hypothetical protein
MFSESPTPPTPSPLLALGEAPGYRQRVLTEHREPVVHPLGVGGVPPTENQPPGVGERAVALRLGDPASLTGDDRAGHAGTADRPRHAADHSRHDRNNHHPSPLNKLTIRQATPGIASGSHGTPARHRRHAARHRARQRRGMRHRISGQRGGRGTSLVGYPDARSAVRRPTSGSWPSPSRPPISPADSSSRDPENTRQGGYDLAKRRRPATAHPL